MEIQGGLSANHNGLSHTLRCLPLKCSSMKPVISCFLILALNLTSSASAATSLLDEKPAGLPDISDFDELAIGPVGSIVHVSQNGSILTVEALQQGQHNVSLISQDGFNNSLDTIQKGEGNGQLVVQKGGEHDIGGYALSADLYQEGTGNGLWLVQEGGGISADISQFGENNMAYAYQSGGGHWVDILQSGADNFAYVNQEGFGHSASIEQYGQGNVAVVVQYGENTTPASVIQTGSEMSLQMLRYSR